MFKKIEINIPFVKALAQIPHYVKFMKDIIKKKKKQRNLNEKRVMSLSKKLQCSHSKEATMENARS